MQKQNAFTVLKRTIAALLILVLIAGGSKAGRLQAQAATIDPYATLVNATTVYNGVDYSAEYFPLFYYLNYPDLQQAFGLDGNALIKHYVEYGRAEHRVANKCFATVLVVPDMHDTVTLLTNAAHDNGGMTQPQETTARYIAAQIASQIIAASPKATQVERASYAAGVVKAFCERSEYTLTDKLANTAYGVFVSRQYNRAGATRALGLIYDYMGITWEHVNRDKTGIDQWCKIIVDKKEGFGDGVAGVAGYGERVVTDGKITGISYAGIRDVFNIRTK